MAEAGNHQTLEIFVLRLEADARATTCGVSRPDCLVVNSDVDLVSVVSDQALAQSVFAVLVHNMAASRVNVFRITSELALYV